MGSGIVLDVVHGSTHHGPGIRSAVILKGCPLRCVWCNNPTARSPLPELTYQPDKCHNCFSCLTVCNNGTHYVDDEEHCIDAESCQADGYCVKNCPFEAVQMAGRRMTAEEVIHEVINNEQFINSPQKNLTISGGEPMQQADFTRELLKLAKKYNIHTCLDTSGYASTKQFASVMLHVDLFLYDYKETIPSRHKEFTGANINLILQNLKLLTDTMQQVILRCPIIPGYNDHQTHFDGIASISKKYRLPVEIMPFEKINTGRSINQSGSIIPEVSPADQATREQWEYLLKSKGCKLV